MRSLLLAFYRKGHPVLLVCSRLEAFDHLPPLLSILDDMLALGLLHETSLGKYLGIILENTFRAVEKERKSNRRRSSASRTPKA